MERGVDKVAKLLNPALRANPAGFMDSTVARGCAFLGAVTLAGAVVFKICRRKRLVLIDRPYLQESVVPDSEELPMRAPNCQVWLAYPNADGNLEVIGAGFRAQFAGKSYLVTAGHNLAFDDTLFLIKGANVVKIGNPQVTPIGTDASLMEVPEKIWSTMGVSVATFSPVPNRGQVHVSICGRDMNGTTGYLTGAPCVGQITYSGTTKGGYSGAPYFSANSVFGMHCHGGRRNGGLSAMYLSALAKLHLGIVDESDYSFSWYKRMYNKSREDPSVQYLNDKAVVMNDDGHVYVMDKTKFEEFNSRLAVERGREEYEDREEELEPESTRTLNWRRPGTSRASDTMARSHAQEEFRDELRSILEQNQRLMSQLVRQRRTRYSRRGSRTRTITSPPIPPALPLGVPSTSTLRGGNRQ